MDMSTIFRPGVLFEPNHSVSMKQSSPLDSPSTSRKISFAGRSAVAGKSEKKTQQRIDSFRKLSNELIPSGSSYLRHCPQRKKHVMDSQQQPTRHRHRDSRKTQILSPNLITDHRRSMKNQTPNQDWLILGTPAEVISLPQETVWKVEACLQKLPGCMV